MWDVRTAAFWYRDLGWNPLPSSRIRRHPIMSFAELWDTPVESTVLENWPIDRAANVQLMCGRPWNLVVVDLDGSAAPEAWRAMTRFRDVPRTWIVRTGSGGIHLYFEIPDGVGLLPRVRLWTGVGRHEAIEVLADRCLVVAPPSRHHCTGEPYEFVVGPSLDLPRPASLPAWLTSLAGRVAHQHHDLVAPLSTSHSSGPRRGPHFDRRAVLDAIRDKVTLVRDWGLRICARRPTPHGWLTCRSIHRDDRHPSAGFHVRSGYYNEPAERERLSLFDVGVRLGVFATWIEACNTLGNQYLG